MAQRRPENHMRLLPPSCPERANAPREAPLPSKLRCAQKTPSLFPFLFPFVLGQSDPMSCTRCVFPSSRSCSTLPFIFTPLPPAMNDSLGEAPFLHQKAIATIHSSPALVSLISLCCVTLEKPLRSRTCFFFPRSLLLFL